MKAVISDTSVLSFQMNIRRARLCKPAAVSLQLALRRTRIVPVAQGFPDVIRPVMDAQLTSSLSSKRTSGIDGRALGVMQR